MVNIVSLDFTLTLSRRLLTMSITFHDAHPASRPLDVAFVIRDGGGTAPVELIVAARLRDRGHRITLYGPPEVHDHAHAAGFDLQVLEWPPRPYDTEDLIPRMADAAEAWAVLLAPRVRDDVDLVVADCAVFGALIAAKAYDVPSAAVMPTVYVAGDIRARADHVRTSGSTALNGINHARRAFRLPDVASITEQILDTDRLLLLTSRAFELPELQPPDHARYVGPQLPQPHDTRYRLPEGDNPLVLISLSTTDQGQLDLLRRLLSAVAPLPVRALVTLGHAVDADQLDPPPNAVLERFVPHAAVLPHTSLVVTHAGHGTVMAAVDAGVPLVCVPMGRDQPAVAARVIRHGLGVQVEPSASVEELRAAMSQVLRDPRYHEAALTMAKSIEPANRVVEELESLCARIAR
jgi:MGT family glycosyltransferase